MQMMTDIPEQCTAEDAAALTAALAPLLGIGGDLPDVRTLRLWRAKRLLTIEGRRFTRRNVLEILALLKLRQAGLAQQYAAKRTLGLDEKHLRLLLGDATEMPLTRAEAEPLITLQLLARGIIEQYRLVRRGAIVGHTARTETGLENTPQSLQQAMARLGRDYFVEGVEDRTASVHYLLQLCTKPLATWAPRSLSGLERYRDAILIDPVYLVPNEDCEVIAEEAEGGNLSDLIERHLHAQLCDTLKKLGADADPAYTTIREFVGRHPLATATELKHLYLNPELNDEAICFVRGLYSPVHAREARNGLVRRCTHCAALIVSDGACTLAGCNADHPTKDALPVPLTEAYEAHPEVLKYWADPAREELRLYDTLRKERHLYDMVRLYPHSDWCDVSIGEEVGVDVKDYHDPARLAQRLNRSIGHLGHYHDRILAVARRRWTPTYRDQLLEQLTPERRASLRVMSVDQAIAHLKKAKGENYHA